MIKHRFSVLYYRIFFHVNKNMNHFCSVVILNDPTIPFENTYLVWKNKFRTIWIYIPLGKQFSIF